MGEEIMTPVMDGRHSSKDETWEEHKKRYHHGKEPSGKCEWRDSHGVKWVIPEVPSKKRIPYGTEWFYKGDASARHRHSDSRKHSRHEPSDYRLMREDLLPLDYFSGKSHHKDRRPVEERLAEVPTEQRRSCEALFDDLSTKGISVSPALRKLSVALMCGLDVKDKDIMELPEVKSATEKYDEYAKKRKAEGLSETTGYDYSGARTDLRKSILEAFSTPTVDKTTNGELDDDESYTVEQGKRLDIITGSPASGKSSTFAAPLSRLHKARLCDPDQIKTMIPEYADGLGAGIVHNESKVLCRDVMYYAMDRGDNIVFPTLGGDGNTGRLIRIIEDAHARGYTVNLHYNAIDRNKAVGRMLYRLAQTGRFIPLNYFNTGFDDAYRVAKKYCETAQKVEQGAGKDVKPKVVDKAKSSLPAGKYEKTEEARTTYFYAAERMPAKTPPPESKKRKDEDVVISGLTPDEILYDWYV